MNLDPITFELALRCSAEDAFTTYTERIAEWWDPRYTANPETLMDVTIEPRAGGRVYATHSDSGEHDWGHVTVWEPARRLVHTFTLAQDPAHPSEVTIDFSDGRVDLAHGGWTEANAGDRKKFSDWPQILDRYASLANRQ